MKNVRFQRFLQIKSFYLTTLENSIRKQIEAITDNQFYCNSTHITEEGIYMYDMSLSTSEIKCIHTKLRRFHNIF